MNPKRHGTTIAIYVIVALVIVALVILLVVHLKSGNGTGEIQTPAGVNIISPTGPAPQNLTPSEQAGIVSIISATSTATSSKPKPVDQATVVNIIGASSNKPNTTKPSSATSSPAAAPTSSDIVNIIGGKK